MSAFLSLGVLAAAPLSVEPRPEPGPDPSVIRAAELGATISPRLVVAVDNGVTRLAEGERVTYTLVVGNDSPARYDDVVVSHVLPRGVLLRSAESPSSVTPGEVFWRVGLAPGERRVLTVTAEVGEGGEHRVATACVAPGPGRPLSSCDSDDDAFRALPGPAGWAPVATVALTGIVVTGSVLLLRLRWTRNDARKGGRARRWRLN
ncbi:hypothetical protein AB0I28_33175 [Phytomonospora sp. NPDC050363]|uniref:hypothetical protein n=1 Tax=Phytomonospora sp. NPDC050363 TaxID=3155642 RepID=UPI0033E0EACA